MKYLGLFITAVGILMVGGAFVLTPAHAYNPVDSDAGINAGAAIAYSGVIVFGIGIVMFLSTQPLAGVRKRDAAKNA